MDSTRSGNPNLRRLVSGNAVSSLGNAVYLIGVTLLLKELTESPAILGLFQFLALFPGFLLSPLTGALIDRHSRLRLVVLSDFFRGVVMVAAGLALFLPGFRTVWFILPVSLLSGIGHAVFVPAAQALLPSIVHEERLQQATALRAMGTQLSNLGGNAAGGLLYALLGAPLLFLANGVSFLLSALFESRISEVDSRSGVREGGLLAAARAGVLYLRGKPALVRLFISQACLFLLSPALMLALPFIVIDGLNLPASAVGLFYAAALAGGIGFFVAMRRLSSAKLLSLPIPRISYAGLTAAFALAAVGSAAWHYGVVAVLIGISSAGVYLFVTTWIQLNTPVELHGRLFALLEAASAGIGPVSYLLAGTALEALGPARYPTLFVAIAALGLLWTLIGPRVGVSHKTDME